MPNKVTLEYNADGDKLIKESRRVETALGSTEDKSKKTGSAIASSFKFAAAGIAAAGIGSLLHGMFDEAQEAQKVSASTAQGIKTMGAEAWTSADAIGALSESISNKIGVDDEAIQSSANLLLTFGNVRNQAGAMNDVFDRSVKAAQDLSAKGFGDANAAAKMLGKALNDPLKGMTALSKAGVTFTQAQKDQIKAMVESGDLLGAQKLLLQEVEKQVGGTAEATATGADKMKVQWANFQEDLGTKMLPILEKVLAQLMLFVDWASQHQEIVIAIAAITAGIWLLNAAMDANPVILLISLFAGLVIGLMILWEKSAGFRDFFIGIWKDITSQFWGFIDFIKSVWNGLVDFFTKTTFGKIIGNIFRAVGDAVGAVIDAIGWLIDRIKGAIDWLSDAVDMAMKLIGVTGTGHVTTSKPKVKPPRHHSGTVVPGFPGSEQMAILQAGEKVTPRGQSGGGGGTLALRDGASQGAADFISEMFRIGAVQLVTAQTGEPVRLV